MTGFTTAARRAAAAGAAALLTVAGAAAITVAAAGPADAQGAPTGQATVPSAVPTANTPNIVSGTVFAITQVGSTVIVGGGISNVKNPGSGTVLTRHYLLAYDAGTGQVSTTFVPTLDGTVESLAPGPTDGTVYVGGLFNTVDGVASRGVTLLDVNTGSIVSGFVPPLLNSFVYSLVLGAGHLFVGGGFTTANGQTRKGLVSLDPTTGALDSFANLAFIGHHNYDGSGASGAVGPRSIAVNPAGTRLMIAGNFTSAGGLARDQLAMVDIDGSSAAVDPNWATLHFTAKCNRAHFDATLTDVSFSPDGSYFVTSNTGGTGGTANDTNSDGSRGLCDGVQRWEAATTGSDIAPTWADYTGIDSLWVATATGSAVYVGGHERWLNNANGNNNAGAGAVPRPGITALDPVSGVPLLWNPGRNPRGVGVYAIYATDTSLTIGSDTDYIGNMLYKRQKIASFPIAGGYTPAATTTTSLPSNLYLAGPLSSNTSDKVVNNLDFRAVNGSSIGNLMQQLSGVSWSTTRGAFMVGNSIFYPSTDGNFYRASFDGSTVGTPTVLDPYDDPYWDGVATGAANGKGTYQGVKPTYYNSISSITGEFYTAGRLYYTLANSTTLHWRWFSPDSGTIGALDNTITGTNLSKVAGMVLSGSTLYYASSADGTLHTETFTNGAPVGSTDATISGPSIDGRDWRARGLFLNGTPRTTDTAPTAVAGTPSCTFLTCSFDGSGSTDSDGAVYSYAWNFGDGTTGTGPTPSHTYPAAGTYTVTLTVTDNNGAASSPSTTTATVTAPATVAFVGAADTDTVSSTPSVTVPSATAAGQTELLYASVNTAGVTPASPTGLDGWTQVAHQLSAPLETTVWQRTATAGDAGQSVSLPLTSSAATDLQLVVYSGVNTAAATTASAGDSNTASHTAPAVTTTTSGSWVVSYWAQKTSSASTWTTPSGITVRGQGVGSANNHIDSLLGDPNAPVATGTYPAQTATAGVSGGKGASVSVVLSPGTAS